jgi:hypothetical protein
MQYTGIEGVNPGTIQSPEAERTSTPIADPPPRIRTHRSMIFQTI